MRKILVAMSGGVDSAAACVFLQEQGYEVGGGTMLLRDGGEGEAKDAENAAKKLNIPFYLLDCRKEFRSKVIEPFIRVYQQGGTPNPCIFCNGALKFGLFLDKALEMDYDAIATGHYVRVEYNPASGRWCLKTAAAREKDQTYMLYGLTQHQLSHTVFPLGGEISKEQVRAGAERGGLDVAAKRDSQDICFIPDGDYMAYFTANGVVPQKGNFIDPQGKVLGEHRGLEAYTVGQRRGLNLPCGSRVYVLGKQGKDVLIGPGEALFSRRVFVEKVNYIPFQQPSEPIWVEAKLRYSQRTARALLTPTETGCQLLFDEPQRAVTPGQAAVFYDGDLVLGGGTICGAEED